MSSVVITPFQALSGSGGPNPDAQLGNLDSLVLGIIKENNPAVLPSVCNRFSALSQDEAFALKVFNGFSQHIQQQIRGTGPLPSASELQVRAYPKLRLELEQLGLDPTVIGFDREDLASYRRADRLIEAKNFCLFCSKIPGMQVDEERLNHTADIFELRDSCLQQFDQLPIAAINALILARSHLTRLPIEIGRLTALQALSLDQNHLTVLPDALGNLVNLHTFYANDNLLTALPGVIGQLTSLRVLKFNQNRLTELPRAIGNLVNLQKLSLKHNQLQMLPEAIGNLINMVKLSLQNNNLQRLPDVIGNFAHLEILYLKNNQLEALPATIGHLGHLRLLGVENNQLKNFPRTILSQNEMLQNGGLIYDNNPLAAHWRAMLYSFHQDNQMKAIALAMVLFLAAMLIINRDELFGSLN